MPRTQCTGDTTDKWKRPWEAGQLLREGQRGDRVSPGRASPHATDFNPVVLNQGS